MNLEYEIQNYNKIIRQVAMLIQVPFLITIISLLCQMAYSQCAAPTPYSYSGNCYAECPWNPPTVTYLYGTDNSCRTSCPGPNHFADDSTKKCVTTCPTSPIVTYYDKNRQRCVQNCSSNPSQYALLTTNTCVQFCPSDLFADDSTRSCVNNCPSGTNYQVSGSLRICVSRCLPNTYADLNKTCVAAASCPSTPVKYYGDDYTNTCVQNCPQNNDTYAQQSSRKCVLHCSLGTFGDPTTLRCVDECPITPPRYFGSNTTRMCQLLCPQGQFADGSVSQCVQVCSSGTFGDYSTRRCVQTCPQSLNMYADSTTSLCIAQCSPGTYADNDTRSCVASTDCSDQEVGNPLNYTCVKPLDCPNNYFVDWNTKMCVTRCSGGQFANLDTRFCQDHCDWNPPVYTTWKQSETSTCVTECPHNPLSFADNSTQSCVNQCPEGTFGDISTFRCVLTCPDGFYSDDGANLCIADCTTNTSTIMYFYKPNTTCVTACPQNFYADNMTMSCVNRCPNHTYGKQSDNTCVFQCPNGLYGDKHSQMCVDECPILTGQYADDSTNMCVDVCPVDPDYFGQDLSDNHRKCVSECSVNDTFADPLTRLCVNKCNLTAGYFAYPTNGRCQLLCPIGWGNPLTGRCVGTCPQSPSQTFGDNITMRCVTKCPNNTYGDLTNQICMIAAECAANSFGDDSTNLCVKVCPIRHSTFGDPVTKKCVLSCQDTYYADNNTRQCRQTCSARHYKDPSTKRCVRICPSIPDFYNEDSSMSCVPTCSNSFFAFTDGIRRQCVSMCPSSPAFFADQQTRKCVPACANQTYRFINNTYRGCLDYCPPQIFNTSHQIDLFADNTTWTCVSVCPQGYWAWKHPSIVTKRLCVKYCQIVSGDYYFANNVSRSCVLQCPMQLHLTYGDRINFQCVNTCSRKQFRDNDTKQCQYRCTGATFADNTTYRCVPECPDGTFAQSVNKTCVLFCPKGTYAHDKKCLPICPVSTVYYSDNTTWQCVQICPSVPDYYADDLQQLCVQQCSGSQFANPFTRQCQAAVNCTLCGTYTSPQCKGDYVADPLTKRCLAKCSTQPMYFLTNDTNVCGPVCTNGQFADNTTNTCVEVCPGPHYYGVNSSANFYCTEYCPANNYKNNGNRMCVSICPQGKYADNMTMSCVSTCPDKYYANQADNTCILSCNPLYADDLSKSCQAICPNGTTASNNSYKCQQQCDYGQYQQNKVCESGCSSGLFADNLTRQCVLQCPGDPFTFADSSNNKCVFKCSPGLYGFKQNRTCQVDCPVGLFKELTNRTCIYPCLENQFADPTNNTCALTCSSTNYPWADQLSRQCVDICPEDPDLYGLNNKCIRQCPDGKFAQNFTRTCVAVCPQVNVSVLNHSYADNLTRRCVQRCSALSYAHNDSSANVCINQCPMNLFASQIQQACVTTCPGDTYAQNSTHTCVYLCPLGQYADTNTQTCMDACHTTGQYEDNSTRKCVTTCPTFPDLYANNGTSECVIGCPINLFAYNITRECVSTCPSPYFADSSTGLCVLGCPVDQLTYADEDTRTCKSSCHNVSGVIYYADRTARKCVTECPEEPKYYAHNQTNTCLQLCPQGTYGDNDTRLCLEHCIFEHPKFTWQDDVDNFCVELCPEGYFSDNFTKKCQLQCSTSTFADNSTNKCVFLCPAANPVTYGYIQQKKCVYFCPDPLFADQVTRTCVSTCPITPNYYFHYEPTNKCVKQCIYPFFGQVQSQNCIQNCKNGFYGNLTTHKCEACQTQCITCQAYLQCTSCAKGFYLYEFQCVNSCPSFPVVYFAHLQSATCFKTCLQPFFGVVSTGLCQLSCPVLFFANPLNRRCTRCPVGCITCDLDGCYSCQSQYIFVNQTLSCNTYCNDTHIFTFQGSCFSRCPDGSYLTRDLVTCLRCNQQCATCTISAANCTKCAYKFYYLEQCIDQCPLLHFVNNDLACIPCDVNPDRCILPPLTYTVHPFNDNYQLHAFVVFNRPVNITLTEFSNLVQIVLNGKTVKSNQFKANKHNTTTYKVTFLNYNYLSPGSGRLLNQAAINISIGFPPGSISDGSGNILTVNAKNQTFQDDTGVTQQIAQTSAVVGTSTEIYSWIVLGVFLLFLLKGGYPTLITIEVAQIIYMHIFIMIDPMPYVQLKFLQSMKNFHFLFIPNFFPTLEGYTNPSYDYFLENMSFLYNCSPFICVFAAALLIYLVFSLLSSKRIISNKSVYRFAKSIRKHRLRYDIFNEAFWFTYLYAVFMAATQFKQASFAEVWDIVNILLAAAVFLLFVAYTVFMVYMGYKYRSKDKAIPRKWSFMTPQPSSFPLEMPLRYLRKFMFCMTLIIPHPTSQLVILMMINFVFLVYLLCFMPSQSKITNAINIVIQSTYIIIEGMFFAYLNLVNKNVQQQTGFAIGFVVIQSILLLLLLVWMIYRFAIVISETQTWKTCIAKLTQNTDPDFLKQQQRKRDLQFDFGSLQNKSQAQLTQDLKPKKFKYYNGLATHQKDEDNIFDQKHDAYFDKEQQANFINEKKMSIVSESQKNLDKASSEINFNSKNSSEISEKAALFEPRKTQKIKGVHAGKAHLKIQNNEIDSDLDEIRIDSSQRKQRKAQVQTKGKDEKAIWDDIQFDDNEI